MQLLFRILFLSIFLAGFSSEGEAQVEDVDIKIYGFEEGLTHRNVFKIAQDPQGFIWIATINGLNKFDGHNFVQYSSNDPEYHIPFDYISDMLIDSDSMIWMANPNYLTRLDPATNVVTQIKADSTSALYEQPRTFSGLSFSQSGSLLLHGQLNESGVSYLQRFSSTGLLEDVLEGKGVYTKRAVLEVNGFYYLSDSENQLSKVDQNGKPIKTYDFPQNIKGLSSVAWVNQLQLTNDGTIWALLNNGQVYFLEKDATRFQAHPMNPLIFAKGVASALLVEENGDVWVGGLGNLWYYEASAGKTYNYDRRIRDIIKNNCTYRQIFKDALGVVWVASDYGAIKLVRNEKIFTKYMDEGNEYCDNGFCSMRGITEDEDGNIYFSYYNSIHVLDVGTNSLRPLFPQNDFFNFPFGLVYHDDALYTGNGRRIDLKTLEVDTLFDRTSIDLGFPMVDHEGEIWMGYQNAVYIYNPKENSIRDYKDPTNQIDTSKLNVSYLYQSPDQTIWLCTLEDGLYRINKEEGVIGHYNASGNSTPRLRHNKVNGVFEDSQRNLWLGTGSGLHRWNLEDNRLKIYDNKTGLANNFINGLLGEKDSCIWVSTDNGLARVDPSANEVALFFKQDGLAANEFNRASFYKAKNGRMFFGGLNGINAFYPSEGHATQVKRKNSKVLFSGFSKLDGDTDSIISKRFGLTGKNPIELSYKDRFFSFEFALANYKKPGSNTYSYKLEGYEKKWSKPSQLNIASYNAVPAGNYLFKVRAANGPGNWNGEELEIPVIVEEAFYKTWWFLGLVFLLALGLTGGILEYRLYIIRKQKKKLEQEVKARTLELEHEKRKSDELLLNILPASIAEELKQFGKAKAKRYDDVTVLFTDFKGFTKIAEQLTPEELVAEIDFCFRNFDAIIEKHGLEKIKTIGDAYMCVGGLPKPDVNNSVKIIKAALDIRDFMLRVEEEHRQSGKLFFEIRLGVHTGDVVSGIVGTKKFVFDIWGDAVNIAARMEDASEEGKVNVSGTTYKLIKDHFACEYRGKIAAKNKGEVDMYFVENK